MAGSDGSDLVDGLDVADGNRQPARVLDAHLAGLTNAEGSGMAAVDCTILSGLTQSPRPGGRGL